MEHINGYPLEGYKFLKEFDANTFIKIHNDALIESGDRPYNIKYVRTFNNIIWQLNEFGKTKANPYIIADRTLRDCIQMADDLKPFENGNHRTGWSLIVMILNGFDIYLVADENSRIEFCKISIFLSKEECITWLKNHS